MDRGDSEAFEAVRAEPDNPEPYLVYADWLQRRGDPRGELISLQHRISTEPENVDLYLAETRHILKHAQQLLGPPHSQLALSEPERELVTDGRGKRLGWPRQVWHYGYFRIGWRYGFASHLEMRFAGTDPYTMFERFIQHPTTRVLSHLTINELEPEHREDALTRIVGAVTAAPCAAVITEIDLVGDRFTNTPPRAEGSPAAVWACPRLRLLDVELAKACELGLTRHHKLEVLGVGGAGFGVDAMINLSEADVPALHTLRLHLRKGTAEAISTLDVLFRSAIAKRLRFLHLGGGAANDQCVAHFIDNVSHLEALVEVSFDAWRLSRSIRRRVSELPAAVDHRVG